MLGGMIEMFRQRLDIQLLGGFSTLTSVTQYGVGTRLPMQFFDFLNALFGGHLMAGLSQIVAKGEMHRANEAVFRMIKLSAFITVTGCSMIGVFGESFLECWLGPGYETAATAMLWITIAMGLNQMHSPLFSLLGAQNAYDQVIYKCLATSILNFIVSLVLVQWFGLMGVVWGTVLEYVLWGLLLWPRVGAHQMGVSVSMYWGRIFGQSVAPSALAAIPISLMVAHWIAPDSFVKLAFSCLCVALPLSLVGWFLVFRKDERKWISDRFGFKSKPQTP
jgi:O-antigen/teichoic acid export membrane protein